MTTPRSQVIYKIDEPIKIDGLPSESAWEKAKWSEGFVDIEGHQHGKPEDNWVWSQQGVINMHYPERWGMIRFSDLSVGQERISFQWPEAYRFSKYLWFVYYKQQGYRKEHGKYAASLSDLGLHQFTKTNSGDAFLYDMDMNGSELRISLRTENGLEISIDQNGYFQIEKKEE